MLSLKILLFFYVFSCLIAHGENAHSQIKGQISKTAKLKIVSHVRLQVDLKLPIPLQYTTGLKILYSSSIFKEPFFVFLITLFYMISLLFYVILIKLNKYTTINMESFIKQFIYERRY